MIEETVRVSGWTRGAGGGSQNRLIGRSKCVEPDPNDDGDDSDGVNCGVILTMGVVLVQNKLWA